MRLGRAEDDVTGNIPAKVLHADTIAQSSSYRIVN